MINYERVKTMKYYVVNEGRQKGIYDTWEKCRVQIHGVTNDFRKFNYWKEVQEYVLFEMSDDGPFVCDVKDRCITFKTFSRFSDYVLKRRFR